MDVDVPKLLRQLADDAKTYQRALEQLARNPERLADQLRTGKDPRSHAPEWLNEQLTEGLSGGTVFETLGRQRQWMRNDWNGRVGQFEDIRVRLASLRTRAAIGSLSGLVGVLAAFLILGVLVPLAYLSARAGSSRISLLIAFGALALLFLLYLANEVRRLTNAMHLEQEFW